MNDLVGNFLVCLLIGCISFIAESGFFSAYAPSDSVDLKAFVTREKAKAILGAIGCVFLVSVLEDGKNRGTWPLILSWGTGMFAAAQWIGSKIRK